MANKEFLESMAGNFKDLVFSVSIDGIGDKFEYLRHPGKWEEVEKNLDFYYSLHTGYPCKRTNYTYSYSIERNVLAQSFMNTLKTHYPRLNIWNNIAHYPKWLTCAVLPAINAKKNYKQTTSI